MTESVLRTLSEMPGRVAVEQDVKKVVGAELAKAGPGRYRRLHHRWALLKERLKNKGCIEARGFGRFETPSGASRLRTPLDWALLCERAGR